MLDASRLKRAEALFQDLVDLPLHQRDQVWAGQRENDEELRSFVEQLLAHDSGGMIGFLSAPAGVGASGPREDDLPPASGRIGSFELLRRIGEGGMGVVYEARQASPGRTVALKILRGGRFIDEYTLRLFQREIQALARLRHRGVAAIYEAGRTEEGQHYFAMDLVRGRPLLQFVQEERPGLRPRLDLFRRICDAIHYAHQRGVMHRDLKPGNILVEDDGNPKILDFGLARILDADFAAAAPHTATGRIQGTLAYMSPEQARGDRDAIDIRSDVYSLGVVLYEMLTGRLPYEVEGLALPQAVGVICSKPPPRPSAAASASSCSIRADLEAVVLKALEKEPPRRYASAAALSEDIQRFLTNQPVLARPASTLYQLRKLVARHRWPSALVTVVLILIVSFGFSMSVLYRRQYREWQRAENAETVALKAGQALKVERDEARAARDAEAEQRRRAEQESARAGAVTEFLITTLGLADPDVTQAPDMTMKAMLDQTAELAAETFAEQPESEAQVRLVIGRAYASLGELEAAHRHLERALEIRESDATSSAMSIYEVLWPFVHVLEDEGDLFWPPRRGQLGGFYGRMFASHPELAATWSTLRPQLGSRHDHATADPLVAEFCHAAEAALESDDPLWLVVADFFHLAGGSLGANGKPGPACEFLARSLEIERRFLPETHTRIVRTLGELVRHSIENGRHEDAEALTRTSLDLLARILPADHWYLAVHRGRLGGCLIGQGRLEEAEALLSESLQRITEARGENNSYAREISEHMIRLYEARGQHDLCNLWRRSLAARIVGNDMQFLPPTQLRLLFGPEYAAVCEALLLANDGFLGDSGGALISELIEVRRRLIPDDHVAAHVVAEWLQRAGSRLSSRRGAGDLPLVMCEEAVRILRAADYLHPWKKACCLWWFAANLANRGDAARAEPLAREAAAILEVRFGNRDHFLSNAHRLHGECLVELRRFDEAEPLLVSSYEELLAGPGPANQNTIIVLNDLVKLYADWGRLEQAMPHLVTYSRARPVPWSALQAVLNSLHPPLAEALQRLRASPRGDRAERAGRLEALFVQRAGLAPHDPVLRLYADGAYRMASDFSCDGDDPIWAPTMRDVLEIERAFDAASPKLILYVAWVTILEIERGNFAAAEPLAREGVKLVSGRRDSLRNSRKAFLGAALAGLGNYTEAEELLRSSYPPRGIENDQYGTRCFGYLMDLYSAAAWPAGALEFAEPIMRRALQVDRDARYLDALAWRVVRRSGLGEPLYALALELAQAAGEPGADDGTRLRTLGAAQFRNGRYEEALATLRRAEEINDGREPAGVAFLAMTQHELGQDRLARSQLARLRDLVGQQGDCVREVLLSLLHEVEQMIE